MSNIPGDIVKYGDLYYFRPHGWTIWFFWSSFYKQWLRCEACGVDNFWHRHVPTKVDIKKLIVK